MSCCLFLPERFSHALQAHWETTEAAKEKVEASEVKQDDDHAEQVLGRADFTAHKHSNPNNLPNPIRANL